LLLLLLGGSVISTRCSHTYQPRTAQLSLFGIPLWYAANSPRVAIQVFSQLSTVLLTWLMMSIMLKLS